MFLNLEYSLFYKRSLRLLYRKNELLWKIIFGLITKGDEHEKEVGTLTIEDDQSDDEILGVLIPQGNIYPTHATIANTPIFQQIRDYPKEGEV